MAQHGITVNFVGGRVKIFNVKSSTEEEEEMLHRDIIIANVFKLYLQEKFSRYLKSACTRL